MAAVSAGEPPKWCGDYGASRDRWKEGLFHGQGVIERGWAEDIKAGTMPVIYAGTREKPETLL
jgi:hypothetical protein